MALTGKTIGQLAYLAEVTNDTLFPVEVSGDTFHLHFSAMTDYVETTYDELYSLYTGNTLIPGRFYLITDFQTCYDQPNFTSDGTAITEGNYKTGETEPLVVFAISGNTLSKQAFSPQYPNDSISYDITFRTTEVTSGSTKGRITERIDEKNNRADYDFRAVQFIRYEGFFSEADFQGQLSIDSFGNVTGVGTLFDTYFDVGDILGVYYNNNQVPIGCFQYYEILSISGETGMTVTGTTIITQNNTRYSRGQLLPSYMSPYKCNVESSGYTGFSEYYTFNSNQSENTYIGNNVNYDTFLLSNNVFLSGPYRNNYFGGSCVGNTFNDDMNGNICGSNFRYNIITNDFDENNIGDDFRQNVIDCDMYGNLIKNSFQGNTIGDSDGFDFDRNIVMDYFSSNFILMDQDDFSDNTIGYNFYNNFIDSSFRFNKVNGNFYDNYLRNSTFNYNDINTSFNNNIITGGFSRNKTNYNFSSNTITGTSMDENIIGTDFNSNEINGYFSFNNIQNGFYNNTIGDGFGFGGGQYRGNIIGNNFSNNTIGEYFYTNTITDNFTNNLVGNYFQNNIVSHDSLNSVNFNAYFGNISGFTYAGGVGGTDGTYTNVIQSSTSANGIGAEFTVDIGGGSVTAVTITVSGNSYQVSEILTISGGTFGGGSDLTITVTSISDTPLVYTTTTCTISTASNSNPVITTINGNDLSLYVSTDIDKSLISP